LSKLEQGAVGEAPVAVPLRGRDQSEQQRRPHLRELGGDRIAQHQLRFPAAEQFGLLGRDERPGHRLDQASRSERAPDQPLPPLRFSQHRLGHAGIARHWRGRHAIDAHKPHHLFDQIGGACDVGAP
jgi:hypothetical protein